MSRTADLLAERNKLKADLKEALDAIEDAMVADKGLTEEEWVEWSNQYLPLMKRNGRMKYTVSFH